MIQRIKRKIEQLMLERLSKFLPTGILLKFLKIYGFKIKSLERQNHLYKLVDSYGEVIWFTRIHRILRYRKGVFAKLNELQEEYLTDGLELKKDDTVIDVGANIGEYTMYWEKIGCKCVSLEPDHTEFDALKMNAEKGSTIRKGAWHSEGELLFYHKNETADSSLIETNDYDYKSSIEVISLDLALSAVPSISL